MIHLHRVVKLFGSTRVVDDLTLEVGHGELLCLLGASGCGKTTTLRMINRLIEPTTGEIRVGDRNVRDHPPHELRRRIGYVFQETGLFPLWTVAENIGVTPRLSGWSRPRIEERIDELLDLVQLEPGEYRDRRSHELSGGQRQRVGLARALAAEPEAVLLDEPFGALDPTIRDELQQAFIEIQKRLSLTTVFVTHDMAEALLLADRVAVLDRGRLVQLGAPGELLNSPASDYVARLVATPQRQAAAVASVRETDRAREQKS